MLVNKRPLAFKPLLSNQNIDPSVPNSVIALHLHISEADYDDPDWILNNEQADQQKLYKMYKKFQKVKSNLHALHHNEFVNQVKRIKYLQGKPKKKTRVKLEINDIVDI
ncbi:UNVERIFIED_CONTAM: hypothetical protein RMT77_016218 [Armadillidium vulgare]